MKRFLVALLIVLGASCSKKNKGEPCTGAQRGTMQCAGTIVQRCDGGHWTTLQDCAGTGETCREAGGIPPSCGPRSAVGEACHQSGECADGLQCSVGSFQTDGVCLALCDPVHQTGCTGSDVCAGVTSTSGVCGGLAAAGNACIDDVQCPADAPECHWFRGDELGALNIPLGACAQSCVETEIGQGQGSCPAGFDCLESPYRIDPQASGGQAVSCTSDANCDTASGFTCTSLVQGEYCARAIGVCGYPLPMYGSAPADTTLIPVADRCGLPFQAGDTELRYYCGVTDPTATVRPVCMAIFPGDLFEGVCVGSCTSPAECGAGYDCTTPGPDTAIAWETQKDAFGKDVTCIKTGSNTCAGGYQCETLSTAEGTADYCGRPTSVCTKV